MLPCVYFLISYSLFYHFFATSTSRFPLITRAPVPRIVSLPHHSLSSLHLSPSLRLSFPALLFLSSTLSLSPFSFAFLPFASSYPLPPLYSSPPPFPYRFYPIIFLLAPPPPLPPTLEGIGLSFSCSLFLSFPLPLPLLSLSNSVPSSFSLYLTLSFPQILFPFLFSFPSNPNFIPTPILIS